MSVYAYVGSFELGSRANGRGISAFRVGPGCSLEPVATVPIGAPSFLAVTSTHVYAACRGAEFDGRGVGAVAAYEIDPRSGGLTELNVVDVPSQPAHVSLDRSGRFLFVACSLSARVAVVALRHDGAIDDVRQVVRHGQRSLVEQGFTIANAFTSPWPGGSPFPHSACADPRNRFVLVPDLGLNQLAVYRFDSTAGTLGEPARWTQAAPLGARPTYKSALWADPLGVGPRHLTFHPNGRVVYVLNELGSSVTTYAYDDGGGLLERVAEVSTLPPGFSGTNSTAEIKVGPSGRHLYASNRGHDSIAVFALDARHHVPTLVDHVPTGGTDPRNFAFSPDGRTMLVAHVHSDSVDAFAVDTERGTLAPLGAVASVRAPSCVAFALTTTGI